MTSVLPELDPFDVRQARNAPGILREFNTAGVLTAGDIHVALRFAELAHETDERVVLAIALAARGPRLGHVFVDLATIRDTAAVETEDPIDLSTLPWPDPSDWPAAVASSGLTMVGEGGDDPEAESAPLRLLGSHLYLDRYWREERRVAADLRAFSEAQPDDVLMDTLHAGLKRLFPDGTDNRQAFAAASAVLRRLTVVGGGPGTGKTTTVARIVALLFEQAEAAGTPAPLIALAAPTGKASARLEEAVHDEARGLDTSEPVRDSVLALNASTLHRLLGWRPDSTSRFRHNRSQKLPHDVVIVDETSMVSLSLMARLLEAIRPDARIVLVGDPDQLASIEAGAVLGDIVGPAADKPLISLTARSLLREATGHEIEADNPPEGATVADGVIVLDKTHRYGGGIARLAEAIRRGDADEVIAILEEAPEGVTWIPVDIADPASLTALAPVRELAIASARKVTEAATAGNAREALDALGSFRVLCAHRRGPEGVSHWTIQIESWLTTALPDFNPADQWYPGRPLLVTKNDYELGLYNGDTGVVVHPTPDTVAAAFDRRGLPTLVNPSTLSSVDTVYAMTVHKSQGSQFGRAAMLLPAAGGSRLITRELLYTAATRARHGLFLAGTEDTIRASVTRPITRASGLLERVQAKGRQSAPAEPTPSSSQPR